MEKKTGGSDLTGQMTGATSYRQNIEAALARHQDRVNRAKEALQILNENPGLEALIDRISVLRF